MLKNSIFKLHGEPNRRLIESYLLLSICVGIVFFSLNFLGILFPTFVTFYRATRVLEPYAPVTTATYVDIAVFCILMLLLYIVTRNRRVLLFIAIAVAVAIPSLYIRELLVLLGFIGLISIATLIYSTSLCFEDLTTLILVASSAVVATVIIGYIVGIVPHDIAEVFELRWRCLWKVVELSSILAFCLTSMYWLIDYLRRGARIENSSREENVVFSRYLLYIAFVVSITPVLLTHLPTLNPYLKPVSVDTFYYKQFLENADRYGLLQALRISARWVRPFYLLMIYLLNNLVQNPVLLMDLIHPLIVFPLLVYAAYRLCRSVDPVVAPLAALYMAVGRTLPSFLAGGFQANSLALALSMLALSALIGERTRKRTAIAYVLLLIVALIHPWTYAMYSTIVLLVSASRRDLKMFAKDLLHIVVFLMISEAVCRSISMSSSPTAAVGTTLVSAPGLGGMVRNLTLDLEIWIWGAIHNPFMYVPAMFCSNPVLRLMAFPAAAALFMKSGLALRLLLNIPVEILAAEALRRYRRLALAVAIASYTQTLVVVAELTPLEALGVVSRYVPR